MEKQFDNGFIEIEDIMPDSKTNKISKLTETEKQQYLKEKVDRFVGDAMQKDSFPDLSDFQEDENIFLEGLSREMYSVIGFYNLKYYNNDFGKEHLSCNEKVNILKVLGKETDIIMDIRKIIYNELKFSATKESIEDKKFIICNETVLTKSDPVNDIIIELSKKLLLDRVLPRNERSNDNYLMTSLRDLDKEWGYDKQRIKQVKSRICGYDYSYRLIKDFVTKLMHIIVELNMNMIDNEKFNDTKIEFFEAVKNYRGMIYGDRLWGMYMLSLLISDGLANVSNESIDANNMKDKFVKMVQNLKNIIEDDKEYETQVFNLYHQLETDLLIQQKRNNFICCCLYCINKIPSKNFYDEEHLKKIVKILKSNKYLRDKYIDMSIFCSKSKRAGRGCFAIMAINDSGERYVSISGVYKDEEAVKYLISKLIGISYEYVDDEEHYYLNSGQKISLQELRTSGYLTLEENKEVIKGKYNRMFSCCERKFVNYLRQRQLHEIYVKYPPCYMCERMIDYEESHMMCKIEIICPETECVKKERTKKYDAIAKKALNI